MSRRYAVSRSVPGSTGEVRGKMWDYSEKVMDHFMNPRNVGEIHDPDAVGEVGNITCGDALRLTLKIDDHGRIADAKFQTFGCASAIASSSALTELVKGMTLSEASKITNQDLAEYLEGLPEEKMHCSVMGMEALEAAIADWETRRQGEPKPAQSPQAKRMAEMPEGRIVCKCFGVTDTLIERVVRDNGLTTIEQVTNYTKAGGGCRSCHADIQEIIDEVIAEREAAKNQEPPKPKRLTNLQKIRLIEETIEREIRPSLMEDGGDIELIDVDGDEVLVALRGHCAGCVASDYTIKLFVEQKLKEFVSPDLVVKEVGEP